jgi:hypothetical protein
MDIMGWPSLPSLSPSSSLVCPDEELSESLSLPLPSISTLPDMSADISTQVTCDCLQNASAAYCKEIQTAADFFCRWGYKVSEYDANRVWSGFELLFGEALVRLPTSPRSSYHRFTLHYNSTSQLYTVFPCSALVTRYDS